MAKGGARPGAGRPAGSTSRPQLRDQLSLQQIEALTPPPNGRTSKFPLSGWQELPYRCPSGGLTAAAARGAASFSGRADALYVVNDAQERRPLLKAAARMTRANRSRSADAGTTLVNEDVENPHAGRIPRPRKKVSNRGGGTPPPFSFWAETMSEEKKPARDFGVVWDARSSFLEHFRGSGEQGNGRTRSATRERVCVGRI